MDHDFKGITIILNGSCNLNCDYCFINKKHSSVFKPITDELIAAIEDGYYVNKLVELIPDLKQRKKITRLDFWGGEPTLHLDYAYKAVESMLDVAPNIRSIMFSSNFALPDAAERVEKFLRDIRKLHEDKLEGTEPFKVSIQMSIDGPPQFTDRNRGDNVADAIFENFKKLMPKLESICDKNHVIYSTHTHGVMDTETIEMFCDIKNIETFFSYFHKYRMFLKDHNIHPVTKKYQITVEPSCVLMFPTPETSMTGKIGAKACENFYEFWKRGNYLDFDIEFYNNCFGWYPGETGDSFHLDGKRAPKHLSSEDRVRYLQDILKEINTHTITSIEERRTYCGAGINTLLMSPGNKYALCQNIYFDIYPEYVEQFTNDNVPNVRYIKNKNMSYKDEVKKWTFDDYAPYDRFIRNIEEAYTNVRDRSYYGNEILARSFIKASAKAGVIDPKYADADEAAYAAKYIDININCMSLLLQNTGSLYVPILYYVPWYLNGALDAIEKIIAMKIERIIENEQR